MVTLPVRIVGLATMRKLLLSRADSITRFHVVGDIVFVIDCRHSLIFAWRGR